ncbi:MAG TPA: hypothetical protein VFH27_17215 [Longimicrobiaceae bacterium]|nr:hypothetical protein [Longimicrobiaceae bacterium]
MPTKAQTDGRQRATAGARTVSPPARSAVPVRPPVAALALAHPAPATLTPRDVLHLQRTLGNRAVGRLLAARRGAAPVLSRPRSIQRKVGFEFETSIAVRDADTENAPPVKQPFFTKGRWHIEPDAGNMEFVTEPLATSSEVFETVGQITRWVHALQSLEHGLPDRTIEIVMENERRKKKVLEEAELREKRISQIDAVQLVKQAAAKFEVSEDVAGEWVKKHGVFAVDTIVADSKITKGDREYLDMILGAIVSNSRTNPEAFDISSAEIMEGTQFRRLADVKQGGSLANEKLLAIGSLDRVTAAPQATIGITLDKLATAMLLIPKSKVYMGLNTSHEATHTLSSMNPADGDLLLAAREGALRVSGRLRKMVADVPEKGWQQFEGLVALVASYAMKGNAPRNKAFKDAKEIAPLMSRMNFSAMFASLPEALQECFTPGVVATAAGLETDTPVFGKLGFGKGKKGPTLGEWVASIAGGGDVMSAVGGTEVTNEKVGGSPSMGAEEDFDRSDERATDGLVPLELRRLAKGADVEDWEMLAYQVFVFAEAMLKGKYY